MLILALETKEHESYWDIPIYKLILLLIGGITFFYHVLAQPFPACAKLCKKQTSDVSFQTNPDCSQTAKRVIKTD